MTIRSHTTLVGVFPVVSHVGMSTKSAFGFRMTEFAGRFILPFDASWGQMHLPGGDYALYYGTIGEGMCYVEILGISQGSPRGIFLVREQNPASVVQNALVCIQKGGQRMIRTLELPAIGKSVRFADPAVGIPLRNRRRRNTQRRHTGASV